MYALVRLGCVLVAVVASTESDEWEDDADATTTGASTKVFKNSFKKGSKSSASDAVPEYDSSWKVLITGSDCPRKTSLTPTNSDASGGAIRCKKQDGVRKFTFPAGKFDIDEQVVVPANTIIVGNENPVDPEDKEREPELSGQTYFIATRGVSDGKAAYCGTKGWGDMGPGDAEALRIGFLMNSNTTIKHISYQGKDTVRPDDNGNLCGGGVFETPGCVSPGFGDGTGGDWWGKWEGCYDHTGEPNDLILGDGRGVENVLVESVRLNGLFLPQDGDYVHSQGSQVAVWVAMTKDGSPTKNVRIKNLVSMFSRGDGINFHGNVQDSTVEDCYIANTGDDAYAAWGAYAENPGGNVFRDSVAKNIGVARDYGYGVCVAIYGAKDVTVTGIKCIDRPDGEWNPEQDPSGNDACQYGPNCNSCVALIHDGWFGAIYPEGNQIKIYDNEYVDFDGNPINDRPQVRLQGETAANWVSSAPPIEEVSMVHPAIDLARNSSAYNLPLIAGMSVFAGLLVVSWASRWQVARRTLAARSAVARAADSGSSATESAMLLAE